MHEPAPAPEPSRGLTADRNPFRVDRLESLAFRPHDPGLTAQAVVQRFRAVHWHGAVVGPHGSGKSTLLKRLVADAQGDGRRVLRVFINRHTPGRARRAELAGLVSELRDPSPRPVLHGTVVACDGWCHLAPWQRRRLLGAARRAGAHVLGLGHLCGWGLPVIYRTRTTPVLLAALVDELQPQSQPRRPDPAGVEAVRAAWTTSRGNLRHALLGMYDCSAAGE